MAIMKTEQEKDIEFLIGQLELLEHAQDRNKIDDIAKKYNIKRIWEK